MQKTASMASTVMLFFSKKKREAIVCKIKDLYKNIFEQKKKEWRGSPFYLVNCAERSPHSLFRKANSPYCITLKTSQELGMLSNVKLYCPLTVIVSLETFSYKHHFRSKDKMKQKGNTSVWGLALDNSEAKMAYIKRQKRIQIREGYQKKNTVTSLVFYHTLLGPLPSPPPLVFLPKKKLFLGHFQRI